MLSVYIRPVTIFEAIADPVRRELLAALLDGPRCVSDLVDAVRLPQPNVSKHLRVLLAAGAVRVRRDGRMRRYELRTTALQEVDRWLAPFMGLRRARIEALQRQVSWNRQGPRLRFVA